MRPRAARARALLILLPLAGVLLAGCWDYSDIDRRGILLGLGLDRANDQELEVTLDIANPNTTVTGGQAGSQGQGAAAGGSLLLTQRAPPCWKRWSWPRPAWTGACTFPSCRSW